MAIGRVLMKIVLIVVGAIVALIVVALIILGSIDIPAPSGQVEKVIPADRLPH
jgi:hypothetical protein